jgi:hypothetical protein
MGHVTRPESFYTEKKIEDFRRFAGRRDSDRFSSIVIKSPQSNSKQTSSTMVAFEEGVFKRPATPRKSETFKRPQYSQATPGSSTDNEPNGSEERLIHREDYEVEPSPMKHRRGRPSKSDLEKRKSQCLSSVRENKPSKPGFSPSSNDEANVQRGPRLNDSEGFPKRGRGRPRKVYSKEGSLSPENVENSFATPKRGRGRPRKVHSNSKEDHLSPENVENSFAIPKQGQGWPRKINSSSEEDPLSPENGFATKSVKKRRSPRKANEDNLYKKNERQDEGLTGKRKGCSPSKKDELLTKKSNLPNYYITSDHQSKPLKRHVDSSESDDDSPSPSSEKRVSKNPHQMMAPSHENDTFQSSERDGSDSENSDSDKSLPFYQTSCRFNQPKSTSQTTKEQKKPTPTKKLGDRPAQASKEPFGPKKSR